MALDHMALVAVGGGCCFSGPHGSETIGETVFGRLPPPGYFTDSGLKYTSRLSMEKAYLLVLELWPEGQASGLHHI